MKRNWMIAIFASVLVLGCDPGDNLSEDGYSVESFTYNGTSCNKKCDQLCVPQKDKTCCKTQCDKPAAPGCKTDCDKQCLDAHQGTKAEAAKMCCKSACPPPPPEKCKVQCDDLCLKEGCKPGEDLKKKCCKKTCDTEPPTEKPICDKQCADYLTKLGFDKKVIEDKCCKTPKCDPKTDSKCAPPPTCDPKKDPKCAPPPNCDPKKDPKCAPPPNCDPKKDPKCAWPADIDCDVTCVKKLESGGWDPKDILLACCKKKGLPPQKPGQES